MMVVGVMLMGLGLVVGLFGGQMGMRTDDIIGYVIFVFGVIVFSLSFLLFRRLR